MSILYFRLGFDHCLVVKRMGLGVDLALLWNLILMCILLIILWGILMYKSRILVPVLKGFLLLSMVIL